MTVTTRTAARVLLGAAALGAGAIHLALAREHLEEYVPLGVGFIGAGVVQIGWGILIAARDSRPLLLVAAGFSILFLGVYVMSRTIGLPLGPEAFTPEGLGRADLLCCALEVPVAVGAVVLAQRPSALRRPLGGRWLLALIAGILAVGGATSTAVAAPAHEHASCPPAPVLTGKLDQRGVDTGVTAYFSCKLLHEHQHG